MRTVVTARHCQIPASLRERAHQLMDRAARVAHRPQRGQVVFNDEGPRKVVELKLALPRGRVSVATAESSNFRTALDRAGAKLRHQLDKSGDRRSARNLTR